MEHSPQWSADEARILVALQRTHVHRVRLAIDVYPAEGHIAWSFGHSEFPVSRVRHQRDCGSTGWLMADAALTDWCAALATALDESMHGWEPPEVAPASHQSPAPNPLG